MRPTKDVVSSQAAGTKLPVDWRENDFKVSLAVVLSGGAVLTYSAQFTLDDIQDDTVTPTWFDVTDLTALSANGTASVISPVMAVRLNVTAYTSGNATLTVIQSGGR